LEEAERYLRTLLRRAPFQRVMGRELAADIAWTLVLAHRADEAERLLTEYNAWDLCPMLVLFMADCELSNSEIFEGSAQSRGRARTIPGPRRQSVSRGTRGPPIGREGN
jgi:hypothetical protein